MGCLVTCGCCAARALRPKGGAPSAQDTRRAMQLARRHSHNQLVVVWVISAASSNGRCLVLAKSTVQKPLFFEISQKWHFLWTIHGKFPFSSKSTNPTLKLRTHYFMVASNMKPYLFHVFWMSLPVLDSPYHGGHVSSKKKIFGIYSLVSHREPTKVKLRT